MVVRTIIDERGVVQERADVADCQIRVGSLTNVSVNNLNNYIDAGDAAAVASSAAYTNAQNQGLIRVIEVSITNTGVTFTSTSLLPTGAIVKRVDYQGTIAHDAGVKLLCGTSGHTSDFVASTDNFTIDDTGLPFFIKEQRTTPFAAVAVVFTLSASSTAGTGVASLYYTVPLS